MQKIIGRLEGSLNGFMEETSRRLKQVESDNRNQKKEWIAVTVSLISAAAALISSLKIFL